MFDDLCKEIREIRHDSPEFVFENADGTRINLIYDVTKNTLEYTEDGVEHYTCLAFFVVDDFSLESYDKLSEGIDTDHILYLTRDSLPKKIFHVSREHNLQEIVF